MERTTRRSWKTLLTGKREVKVGVAVDSQRRHSEVNSAMPGRVRLIDEYLCDDANAVESAVHDRYKAHRFTPKDAGRSAGRTEWFRLNDMQVSAVRRTLKRESVNPGVDVRLPVWALILIFSVVGATVMHLLKDYL